jgi:hypothetical protein
MSVLGPPDEMDVPIKIDGFMAIAAKDDSFFIHNLE